MEVNFRHLARVAAVMALYAVEVGKADAESAIASVSDEYDLPRRWRRVATKTLTAVLDNRADIDKEIADAAIGYTLDRIAAVDRALLRVGIYEIRYEKLPKAVVINEAVEIAKEFSTEDSSRFINGILGKLAE
jgi:N utilization substance protein B